MAEESKKGKVRVAEPGKVNWTKERIQALLESSNTMVERSIVKILENNQTATEQEFEYTEESNGVGFSAFDAEFLTSLGKQIKASTRPEGQRLSIKQLPIARKKMKKYWKQILAFCK